MHPDRAAPENAPAPPGTPFGLRRRGALHIKVTPQGAKPWRVRFKHRGRAMLRSLGRWPEVSVRRAGELADDLRRDIRSGAPAEGDAGPCARIFRDLAADWGGRSWPGTRRRRSPGNRTILTGSSSRPSAIPPCRK
ncbi:MAG: Arm DNA-binding domain-containing protein [Deltaproteobacteria bacterium]|nr:Arm DNA-binding domain-containing protein [Deltaproteobacteria bacterium]